MKKETYFLPVAIEIEAEDPDGMARRIADAIYDAIAEAFDRKGFSAEHVDVKYSIYEKWKSDRVVEKERIIHG